MRNKKTRSQLLTSAGSAALVIGLAAYSHAAPSNSTTSVDSLDYLENPVAIAEADLVQADTQVAIDQVAAYADELDFFLDLFSADSIEVSGQFDNDANTISANAIGNTADMTTDVSSLPSSSDSIAQANTQVFEAIGAYSPMFFDGDDLIDGEDLAEASVLGFASGASITSTAEGPGDDGGVATLYLDLNQATLSLDTNAVDVSATGNSFTGETSIADGVTMAGSGDGASALLYNQTSFLPDGAELFGNVAEADIAMGSLQVGETLSVVSASSEALVSVDLQRVTNSTLSLSDNQVTTESNVMDAAQTIATGEGAADVGASMAVSNRQLGSGSFSESLNFSTAISALASESVESSTVAVDENLIKSSSNILSTNQAIEIAANAVGNIGDAEFDMAFADVDGEDTISGIYVDGQIIAANSQQVIDTLVDSIVNEAEIGLDANGALDSTLSVGGNTIESVAMISTSNNAIEVDANIVSGGIGAASHQLTGAQIGVAGIIDTEVGALVSYLETANLQVSSNTLRSVFVGQTNGNSVAVNATDLELDEANSEENTDTASAMLVSANHQEMLSGEDFAVIGGSGIGIEISDEALDSSVTLDANAIVAAAYGNDTDAGYDENGVSNGAVIDLDATNIIVEDDGADVAAATNRQVFEDVWLGAGIESEADSIVTLEVFGDVIDSSLSNSHNAVQAQAIANQATTLTAAVDAVTIDTDTQEAYNEYSLSHAVEAAFVAISEQDVVSAFLEADLGSGSSDSTLVLTDLGSDVSGATVSSDYNLLSASVFGNNQATGVEIAATDILTTAGVRNDSDTSNTEFVVAIGTEGTEATEATEATVSNNSSDLQENLEIENTLTGYTNNSGQDITFTMDTTLTAAEISFYEIAGFTASGDTLIWADGDDIVTDGLTITVTNQPGFLEDSAQISSAIVTPATDGTSRTHNDAGVIVQVEGDIDDTTISVASNRISGAAKAQVASNVLSVEGTNIAVGQTEETALVVETADAPELDGIVIADYTLTNDQEVDGNDLDVTVYGSFGLETTAENDDYISNSSLAVVGNSLSATAAANVGSNNLAVSATNSEASGVLFSEQQIDVGDEETSIAAFADAEIFAPLVSSESTISLSGNETTSLVVGNDAVNTVSISGVNLVSNESDYAAIGEDFVEDEFSYYADNLLISRQDTDTGSLNATSNASIYNVEDFLVETSGIYKGSVALTDNLVTASAASNNANNSLTLTAEAVNQQSAGLVNTQFNAASVSSDVAADITADLYGHGGHPGSDGEAIHSSSVEIGNNAVLANAIGNVSNNVLNASAASFDHASEFGVIASTSIEDGILAQGGLVVANFQENMGSINAYASDTTIGASLNGEASDYLALNSSSVSVSGNVVQATATANNASNSLTVSGYDGGNPVGASISNEQFTTAMVTAVVSNAMMRTSSVGEVAGSRIGVVGNTMSASATGNVASSVITRR